ncbi:MAG: YdiY family protein [Candidatus Reddybacter sp.]
MEIVNMPFCTTIKPPQAMALTVATLLIGCPALADELLMKDGSRLLGTVVKQDGGNTLDFDTTYAGTITVKWAEVDKVITDEAMTLLLVNGETREVISAQNKPEGVATVAPTGTPEILPLDTIAFVNPEPWRLGEGWHWEGKFNVELNHERGNSDKEEYEGDFSTTFRRIDDRINFRGDYDRETSNDVLTDDDWRLNSRYDHFIDKQFFYGLNVGLEHDRFADLSLRTIIGPVVGYEFFESKATNLGVTGGPMYVKEDFYEADNDDYTAFGWQFHYDRFLIPDRIQFYHRHNGLLSMEDTENFVLDAWTGFRFPIYAGIYAATELLIEYDGGAPADVDNADTTYNVKLGYEW